MDGYSPVYPCPYTVFIFIFLLVPLLGLDKVMLVLTTAVSLEAIYLSLFIQMTVNKNTESLEDVEEDIEEIQEDVENVEGDIDRIQDHVEDLGEEFEDISEDLEKINDGTGEKHHNLQKKYCCICKNNWQLLQ